MFCSYDDSDWMKAFWIVALFFYFCGRNLGRDFMMREKLRVLRRRQLRTAGLGVALSPRWESDVAKNNSVRLTANGTLDVAQNERKACWRCRNVALSIWSPLLPSLPPFLQLICTGVAVWRPGALPTSYITVMARHRRGCTKGLGGLKYFIVCVMWAEQLYLASLSNKEPLSGRFMCF